MGDIYFSYLDDHDNAEKVFRTAINIAPGLLDVYKAYGDFCLAGYDRPEFAIEAYAKALTKQTRDLSMVGSLERCLRNMDEPVLLKKATALKERMMKTRRIQKYLMAI